MCMFLTIMEVCTHIICSPKILCFTLLNKDLNSRVRIQKEFLMIEINKLDINRRELINVYNCSLISTERMLKIYFKYNFYKCVPETELNYCFDMRK